ncbi:uncharacterized protein F4822DRAFT_218710 [Hypoxylon trugodes]|uniref:uncharacterized protein n=1 Tax=Hypoxylon trugodes TaxID=326681 RepID=UPI00219BF436|nr:uncharacterized protein F4822DRAFT_218710 [Hypoxylon trugodes]KAI1389927.1 hypothetical protein F4822DRAFT_218710 [Hypoxylon trugodes]
MVSFTFWSLLALSTISAALLRPPPPLPKPHPKFPFPPFPNISAIAPGAQCAPFEDPHCCIVTPVCECTNGTFFSINGGTPSICGPPGSDNYGQDVSGIPGWCC